MSYANAAHLYWDQGWRGILPIPPGRKAAPPEGWTGRDAADPSWPDIQAWVTSGPDPGLHYDPALGGLALRLPDGVIGLDFDCYGDKAGAEILAGMTEQAGELPPTWTSTARGASQLSGIRLYRVPAGTELPGLVRSAAGVDGLEIIQHKHRYVMAWPSVRADLGGRQYQWYVNGVQAGVPALAFVPELPAAWLALLQKSQQRQGLPVSGGSTVTGKPAPGGVNLQTAEPPMTQRRAAHQLAGICADLAKLTTSGSGRNNALNNAAFRMGRLCGPGGLDGGNAALALLETMEANGYVAEHGKGTALATIESGMNAGLREPHPFVDEMSENLEVEETDVDALVAEFLTTYDLDQLPDPTWLVRDWLEMDSANALIGPSGSMKTFVALDVAAHVALGLPWHGHPVRKAVVAYVVAEGAAGFRKRVRALEVRLGRRVEGLFILPRPVQAADEHAWGVLVAALKRLGAGLVILDTQARVTLGMEENSATEMGVFVERMEQIRRGTGACATVVHHTGHNQGRARGSSALYAAWTSEISVSRDKDKGIVEVKSSKEKDSADDLALEFKPDVVDLGEDSNGDPINSVVLRQVTEIERMLAQGDLKMSVKQLIAKTVIDLYPTEEGATQASVMTFVKAAGHSQSTAYRSWKELADDGRLVKLEGTQRWVWVHLPE